MSLDVVAMQTALVSWVRIASTLPAGSVYMANQLAASIDESGETPFATVQLLSFTPDAPDEVAYVDHSADVPTPVLNQELESRVLSYGQLSVAVQTYTPKAAGAASAWALAMQIQRALGLPSVQALLSNAGMSVSDQGRVVDASTVMDRTWRGRASLSVSFNVLDTVGERLGYIAEVDGTSTTGTTTVPFTAHR